MAGNLSAGHRPCWPTWPSGAGPLVEDGGAHPARALVLPVLDVLQRLDDVVAAAVLLGVLDDLLLRGRVVHAAEGLLDVDGAHHAAGRTPAPPAVPQPPPAVPQPGDRCPDTVGDVDAGTIVGLLADPVRLRVVAALALGAGTIEDVADAAGLSLKEVALAARRLARAGLVHRDGHTLALRAEQFGEAARAAAASVRPVEPLSADPA